MKRGLTVAVCALLASTAMAQEIITHELARVVRVQPITNTRAYTVPRQTCTVVEQVAPAATPSSGEVVNNPQKNLSERCVTYSDREFKTDIIAYDVMFEYRGQLRTTRFNHDPGNSVRVKVVTRIYAVE
jgi:uncharacterized protein YcfJ